MSVLRLNSSGVDEFEAKAAWIAVQRTAARRRRLVTRHRHRDTDSRVQHDVGGRQRDDHRRPDRLHRPGPRAPHADVRVEVQLKPIAPGVVDRSARQTELAAQQSSRR